MLIRDAAPEDLDEVRALFTEYATEAGIDLEFQGFTAELAGLPGKYAAPGGAILLGCADGEGTATDDVRVPAEHTRPDGDADAPHRAEADAASAPRSVAAGSAGGAGSVIGVVAVRPLEGEVCEMKRLFLRPEARGTGAARTLALAIMERARAIGYRTMRLDTLESMAPALRLYLSLGFERVPAYYANPLPDVVYLEREL